MALKNKKFQILLGERDNLSKNAYLRKNKQRSQKIGKEASFQDNYFVGTHIDVIA